MWSFGNGSSHNATVNETNKRFGTEYLVGEVSNINSTVDDIDYTELINEYNLNLQTIKYRRLKKKRCQPIEPDSNFKSSWDIFGLFLILYDAMLIPYRVALNMPATGYAKLVEYSIDIFFIVDLCTHSLY